MASSINASTTAGVVTTADTSGVLNIQTAGTTAVSISAAQVVSFTNAPTVTGGTANGVAYLNGSKVLTTGTALVFDGTNLGVGVTPSAWTLGKAIEVGFAGNAVWGNAAGSIFLTQNMYYDGNFRYKTTAAASNYQQSAGSHIWYNAPSGTAGNVITFTQAMTLDASGNLGIGVTSPTSRLHVSNSAASSNAIAQFTNGTTGTGAGNGLYVGVDTSNEATVFNFYNSALKFGTNAVERARIDSSGNLGVGTTSPTRKLDVATAGTSYIRASNTTNSVNVDMYAATAVGGFGTQSNHPLDFFTNNTDRVRIDTSGNLGIGTTSPSTYGKLAVASTAAAGANVAITKENSGTANQNGQTLYFNNSHAAATGRNANVVAGNIQWQFSQPSSGALQYAGEIAVLSDAQGGASTASSLNLYSSGGLGLTINSSANTVIAGALSKASGSFRIDHPLPELEETHQLVHSFIEGPQADLIYRGKVNLVNGTATVNIDTVSTMTEGTFVTLCRDVQCFTTNESDWTAVRGSVTGNILTIEAQDDTSTASISWMVIGERKDKHMMDTDWTDDNGKVIVEPLKE